MKFNDICPTCKFRNKPVSVCINCTRRSSPYPGEPSKYQLDPFLVDIESKEKESMNYTRYINPVHIILNGNRCIAERVDIRNVPGEPSVIKIDGCERCKEEKKENFMKTMTAEFANQRITMKEALRDCMSDINKKIISNAFEIKDVIFNPPATIVFWADGTKSIVKCENEAFDPEKGLAMAITRKALGNKYEYFNQIKRWTKKYYKTHDKFVAKNPPQVEFTMTGCTIDKEELDKVLATTKDGKKFYLNPNPIPKDDEI